MIFVLEEISLLTVQSASYGLLKDSFVYFIVIIGSSIKIPLPLLSQKINSFITTLFFVMSSFFVSPFPSVSDETNKLFLEHPPSQKCIAVSYKTDRN